MMHPISIQKLIDLFSKFPSVGPKTAERYVFYLLKQNPEFLQELAQTIAELKEKTAICSNCGRIAETSPCHICADSKRDHSQVCVVSDTRDVASIEATKEFHGIYHVLRGYLNPISGIKPEQLNLKPLVAKAAKKELKEVILGLNPTIEGETTSLYLIKLLQPYNIKITRLAKGLPMGADLEYADEVTLGNALKFRNDIK